MKEMIYKPETDGLAPEILHEGDYKGYHFLIVSYGIHPCAYVEIPKGHPWYGKDYCYWNDEVEEDISNIIDCHGGLTYSGNLRHVLGESDRWFLGWDYAHVGDFEGMYLDTRLSGIDFSAFLHDKKWTTEEIYAEVCNVIEQIVTQDWIRKERTAEGGEEVPMMSNELLIVEALKGHVRVNVTLKTVEIYNEYGVQLVLRNLNEATYEAFKATYQNF